MSLASRTAVVAASLALLAGCNDKALQSTAANDAGKRLGSAITAEQAGKVLARVGSHTITLGDFVAAIEHMDQFDRLRYQAPQKRQELLAEMINIQLLADEAEAKGYDKDPAVQQEIRATLREAMMAEVHEGSPTSSNITEAEARAYYDKNRASFRDPERRRVSVLALPDEASAAAVLEGVKKAGTPLTGAQWGELVRKKSVDATAKANVPVDLLGDLGLVSAPGEKEGEPNTKVPPEVRAAVFQIGKVGELCDHVVPVAADHRFYIVRMTQRTEAHDRTYAEADRSIRVKLVQEQIQQREDDLIAKLKAEYPVQIDDAVLATVKLPSSDEPLPGPVGTGSAAPAPGPLKTPPGALPPVPVAPAP